jgi:hypothetical protein
MQLLLGHACACLLAPSLTRQVSTHHLALTLSLCRHRTTFFCAVNASGVVLGVAAQAVPDVDVLAVPDADVP